MLDVLNQLNVYIHFNVPTVLYYLGNPYFFVQEPAVCFGNPYLLQGKCCFEEILVFDVVDRGDSTQMTRSGIFLFGIIPVIRRAAVHENPPGLDKLRE